MSDTGKNDTIETPNPFLPSPEDMQHWASVMGRAQQMIQQKVGPRRLDRLRLSRRGCETRCEQGHQKRPDHPARTPPARAIAPSRFALGLTVRLKVCRSTDTSPNFGP